MKNWKTTVAGIIAGTSVLLSGQCAGTEGLVGAIPPAFSQYAQLGMAVGLMVLGSVAKDSKKVDEVIPKVEEIKPTEPKG